MVGAAFLDPAVYEQTGLTEHQFFDPRLQLVWSAIGSLRQRREPIDATTVSHALGTTLEAVGGPQLLAELAIEVPTSANATHYADIVREAWLTRRVALAASTVLEQANNGIGGECLLQSYQSSLEGVMREVGRSPSTLRQVALDRIKAAVESTGPTGLPTGLGLERFVPGGIPRDKVTCIFADAGTFKTTIKNHFLTTIAKAGFKVLDVSLEDSCELTADRVLSQLTGVPYGRIHGGILTREERDLIEGIPPAELAYLDNIVPGDDINPRIADIIRRARQLKHSGSLDAVAVDYLQLLDGSQKEALDEAMRLGQLSAKNDKLAYIFLSQIKQDVADRENPRPQLRDMLGSSAMRTGSKLAIGLFRPYLHCPQPTSEKGPYGMYCKFVKQDPDGELFYPNILEAHIVKNVSGPVAKAVHLLVQPETGELQEFSERMKLYR